MDKSVIVVIVSGIITGLTGYLIGRPNRKAETRKIEEESISKEISNLRDIIETWREYATHQEKRLEKQANDIKLQNRTIKEQDEKIKELQKQIELINKEVKNQCTTCEYKTNYDTKN